MPRTARYVEQIPEEELVAAAEAFSECALKALEGLARNQRELADRLGWPATTLAHVLKGRFTFKSWPKICTALGKDPIDMLALGRAKLAQEQEEAREAAYQHILQRRQVDTFVALWRRLPANERTQIFDQLRFQS